MLTIEYRQGLKAACRKEIIYKQGWVISQALTIKPKDRYSKALHGANL